MRRGAPPLVLAEVSYLAFGRIGQFISDLCLVVACFGVMCSYLIIIYDMLGSLISEWFGVPAGDENLRIYILCGSMVVLVPLAAVRYLNALRYGSTLAVAAVVFVVVAIMVRSSQAIADGALENCTDEPPAPTPEPGDECVVNPGCVVWFKFTRDIFEAIRTQCHAGACSCPLVQLTQNGVVCVRVGVGRTARASHQPSSALRTLAR